MSQVFPTAFTWILDAYIGETLEQADPEGARYIRRKINGSPWDHAELFHRIFVGW